MHQEERDTIPAPGPLDAIETEAVTVEYKSAIMRLRYASEMLYEGWMAMPLAKRRELVDNAAKAVMQLQATLEVM